MIKNNEKVSVIGGSGFIGTRLCKRLESQNIQFEILDRVESKTYPELTKIVDIRDPDSLLNQLTGDVIINLAAEHLDNVSPKSLYHDVNVQGSENVCDVARKKSINKIIFTSSVAVYGFAPVGTDESGALNPFNEYGKTKLEAEYKFKDWLNEDKDKRTLTIIRPTVVFGEGNRGNVYNLLKLLSSNFFVMIGNGKNIKSMAYVENISAFIEYSLNNDKGLFTHNYVDKPDYDMKNLITDVYSALGKEYKSKLHIPFSIGYSLGLLVDLIGKVLNKKFPVSAIRIKKFCANSSFSSNVEETGFKRPVSLREALNKTISFEFIKK